MEVSALVREDVTLRVDTTTEVVEVAQMKRIPWIQSHLVPLELEVTIDVDASSVSEVGANVMLLGIKYGQHGIECVLGNGQRCFGEYHLLLTSPDGLEISVQQVPAEQAFNSVNESLFPRKLRE